MSGGLLGIGLGKRGLGLGASPPSRDSSSDEEALLGLGGSRGGSSAKRRRGGSSLLAAPPAHAACQNPLHGDPLFDNPLFEEEDFVSVASDESDGEEPYWLRGMPIGSGSGDNGKENTPLVPKGGAGSQDCFAGWTNPDNNLQVLCALTYLEKKGLHPVGEHRFATLDVTIAGMLVLCRRASYEADEMSPQLLLTCLWLLMSTCSQYRAGLNYNANLFLHLHPNGADLVDGLKADMVAMQRQVLRRASWRVLLRDEHEVIAAYHDLLACPDFEAIVSYVEGCAQKNLMPQGRHDYAPGTAAAGAVGRAAGRGPSRVPPPAPRVRSSGSSRSSRSGLDGSYWQAMAHGRLRRSGSQALAPRNR